MKPSPVDQLAQALDATERLVAAVGPQQWDSPTPCSEWNVRDLVDHLVAGNRMFASVLSGERSTPPGDAERRRAADHTGEDPAAAYRAAADALLAALRRPGVLEQVFPMPIGPVPGIVAVHLRITEALVHGWDLARATGQTVPFPDDVVEQELVFSRGKLADVPSTRRPFAPPQPASDDAPAIDRLAALLGRPVAQARQG